MVAVLRAPGQHAGLASCCEDAICLTPLVAVVRSEPRVRGLSEQRAVVTAAAAVPAANGKAANGKKAANDAAPTGGKDQAQVRAPARCGGMRACKR